MCCGSLCRMLPFIHHQNLFVQGTGIWSPSELLLTKLLVAFKCGNLAVTKWGLHGMWPCDIEAGRCHGWGRHSVTRMPLWRHGFNPRPSCVRFWYTKWHWDRFLSPSSSISTVIIIPPAPHSLSHLSVTLCNVHSSHC